MTKCLRQKLADFLQKKVGSFCRVDITLSASHLCGVCVCVWEKEKFFCDVHMLGGSVSVCFFLHSALQA